MFRGGPGPRHTQRQWDTPAAQLRKKHHTAPTAQHISITGPAEHASYRIYGAERIGPSTLSRVPHPRHGGVVTSCVWHSYARLDLCHAFSRLPLPGLVKTHVTLLAPGSWCLRTLRPQVFGSDTGGVNKKHTYSLVFPGSHHSAVIDHADRSMPTRLLTCSGPPGASDALRVATCMSCQGSATEAATPQIASKTVARSTQLSSSSQESPAGLERYSRRKYHVNYLPGPHRHLDMLKAFCQITLVLREGRYAVGFLSSCCAVDEEGPQEQKFSSSGTNE